MGKTKILIDVAANLFLANDINALLVVAPISLLRNYVEEIKTHLLDEITPLIYLYESKNANTLKAKRARLQLFEYYPLYKNILKIVLINSEALLSKSAFTFCKNFLFEHPALLAVDESGKLLKNIRAKQVKSLIKLSEYSNYHRILTGTPITQAPLDLYAQYEFLSPDILNSTTFTAFRARYAKMKLRQMNGRSFYEIVGYQNLEELTNRIRPYTYFAEKSDFLDLPPKIYETRYYELETNQRKLYDDLKKNSIAYPNLPTNDSDLIEKLFEEDSAIVAPNVLAKLTRLQQIMSGYAVINDKLTHLLELDENPRIACLLSILESIPKNEKVIIWARYTQEIKDILSILGDQAISCFGETKQAEREFAFSHFKKDAPPSPYKYLIANPKVAGYGITLTGVSNVVYYSQDFSLEARLQSEDRCHRIGQDKPVIYIDIIAENTIDEHIRKALNRKAGYSDMMTALKEEKIND